MRSSSRVEVRPYSSVYSTEWDGFVDRAKNRHFFFKRGFMEYHRPRFEDMSLMFLSERRLVALLPANFAGQCACSHEGLTYGGLIVDRGMTGELMLAVFEAMLQAARSRGAKRIVYKTVPYIYWEEPAEEDRYALFRNGAQLVRRDLSSVLTLGLGSPRYTKGKRGNIAKAIRNDLRVERLADTTTFSQLLESVLRDRHGVAPVHSREEIEMLASRFPDNVRLYGAFRGDQLLAGTLLFVNDAVVHTQYLANSPAGREMGALDFLVDALIVAECAGKRYLSFGISTESGGTRLNTGLLHTKEAFGARGVVHDTYEVGL